MKDYLKKNYDEGNDIFGYPQVYKGIELWPIKIKDLKFQTLLYQLLAHPKNYIANRDILKASYLKFMVYVVSANYNSDPEKFMGLFVDLLAHVTKIDKSKILWDWKEQNGEGLNQIALFLKINDVIFNENEVDNIREILLEQNGTTAEYIEEYNPDLEKQLEIYNQESPQDITLLDEIFTFAASPGHSLKEVEELTFFQFRNLMEKFMAIREYDLYKPLIVSGQVTLKGSQLKHYFYHSSKKGRYSSILMTEEEYKKSDAYKATLPL